MQQAGRQAALLFPLHQPLTSTTTLPAVLANMRLGAKVFHFCTVTNTVTNTNTDANTHTNTNTDIDGGA